jgi:hypothetical protein
MSVVLKVKQRWFFFVFSILKLLQQKQKEMCSSFCILKHKQREFFLLYLNFYNLLIPTGSCPWFLKVKQRCDQFFYT